MLVAIRRTNDLVSIMRFLGHADEVDAEVAKWQQAHPGEYVSHVVIDEASLPPAENARETWRFNGTAFYFVAVPLPVPDAVSRRQMLLGLKAAGFITAQEAIDAAKSGAVPASIQAAFNTLPTQSEIDAATITWASMNDCERGNALVAMLAAAHQLTAAQVDDLFRQWAAL